MVVVGQMIKRLVSVLCSLSWENIVQSGIISMIVGIMQISSIDCDRNVCFGKCSCEIVQVLGIENRSVRIMVEIDMYVEISKYCLKLNFVNNLM